MREQREEVKGNQALPPACMYNKTISTDPSCQANERLYVAHRGYLAISSHLSIKECCE